MMSHPTTVLILFLILLAHLFLKIISIAALALQPAAPLPGGASEAVLRSGGD